ncbi:MAG: 3-phosphoshikimate 1-carboxyvinyltransferase, partial [Acidobacteria bacterium]|nr:3-phosphoshikimate 1-carboxyvinyltransferase [Acidobacteriota bacterium]
MKPDDSPYRYKYLDGEIQLRGDKSISHRILLLSSIASASVKIHNLSLGQDVQATLNALKKIGVKTVGDIKSELTLNPLEAGSKPSRLVSIDCGNSGTTARLLIGFLSGLGIEAKLYGDESLSQRPMRRVTEPLVSMGGNYLYNKGDCLPLKVLNNNGMHGISYLMPVPSAQVKTSILLAALFSDSKMKILEKNKTRDHTERMLELAGVDIQCDGNRIELNPIVSPLNLPVEYLVPGDISTAAFFIAGALLLPGSEITVKNSLLNEFRTGFLQHFKKMGADIQILNSHTSYNETVGDIYVHFKGTLESIEILPEDIASCID